MRVERYGNDPRELSAGRRELGSRKDVGSSDRVGARELVDRKESAGHYQAWLRIRNTLFRNEIWFLWARKSTARDAEWRDRPVA